jgi:hypothetical protein
MAPAIHRAVAFVVLPAAPTYPSAYGVLVDLDPTRVRGAPTPQTPRSSRKRFCAGLPNQCWHADITPLAPGRSH